MLIFLVPFPDSVFRVPDSEFPIPNFSFVPSNVVVITRLGFFFKEIDFRKLLFAHFMLQNINTPSLMLIT